MANVEIRGLNKSYGSQQVIHEVNASIADGEFIILVGPSGCGKSTILRMIAGLETISGGQVSIGDRVVNSLTPKERNIAFVFQNYALYPQMTVAQNLGFSLEISGVPKPQIKEKVDAAAEILSLTPLLGRKPSQLSGGQRQRVAMGRAIVRDPDVFLFDEPLSNLDAKLRVKMRAEIKSLHQRLGSTIVYVTHDQIEAMTMADRIVVLRAGRVEQIGTPLELYDKPNNMFVAGFIGSPAMNFLKGTIANAGAPTFQLSNDHQVTLDAETKLAGEVVMGVRPQNIKVDPEHGVPAVVTLIEPTGAETQVGVEIAGQDVTCVLPPRFAYAVGDQIRLSFDTDQALFFDPYSEARIS